MKRKYLLAAIALLVITIGLPSSFAYFNAKDTSDNVFTVGDIKIALTEDKWKNDEQHVIVANATFDKNPVVSNIGKNSAYVRIVLKVSNYTKLTQAITTPNFEVIDLFTPIDNTKWLLVKEEIDNTNDSIIYTFNYYQILSPEGKTEPLFEEVIFPNDIDMDIINSMSEDLAIEIKADAIQSDNFNDVTEAFTAFDLKS